MMVKTHLLKTPTFTEEEEDKEDEDEEQQVSIEDTARLEKIESEDEDARRNILLVVLVCVFNCSQVVLLFVRSVH